VWINVWLSLHIIRNTDWTHRSKIISFLHFDMYKNTNVNPWERKRPESKGRFSRVIVLSFYTDKSTWIWGHIKISKCNNSWDTFTTLSICFFMVSSEIKRVSMSLLKRLWKFHFYNIVITVIISFFNLRWKTRHSACIYHILLYLIVQSIHFSSRSYILPDLIITYYACVYVYAYMSI
jgi:hypothetical protein